jgi:Zn-dependent protease with chaperone function
MQILIESFAWCMLQVTLFALVAGLADLTTRRLRSNLSAVLLAVSLAVIAVFTLMSVSPWPRWTAPQWAWWAGTISTKDAESLTKPSQTSAPRHFETQAPTADLSARPSRDIAELEIQNVEAAQPAAQPAWRLLVYAAWAATFVGLARAIVGLVQLRRACRHSTPVNDRPALQLFDELQKQLGIRRSVQLRETPRIHGAATVGWRRPLVLMPSVWRDWSPEELRAVLAHELAHVRRRHFPSYLVSQAAIVAHYYHPLVHWLGRRLRLEQEIDADQRVWRTAPIRDHPGSTCPATRTTCGRVRRNGSFHVTSHIDEENCHVASRFKFSPSFSADYYGGCAGPSCACRNWRGGIEEAIGGG